MSYGLSINKYTCEKCGTVSVLTSHNNEANVPCQICKSVTKHVFGVKVAKKPLSVSEAARPVQSVTPTTTTK